MSVQSTPRGGVVDDEGERSGNTDDPAPRGEQPAIRGCLEVGHVRGQFDHYGARRRVDDELRHMNNTDAGDPGWLGNPYLLDDDGTRREVIAAFTRDFLERVDADPEFREAVEGLRGQRAACWCRGVSQQRDPSNWCHLDVVACWLDDDLAPVREYLRGTDR